MIKKIIGATIGVSLIFASCVSVYANEKKGFFEFVAEHIKKGIKSAYSLCEQSEESVFVPKTAEDIVTVWEIRSAVVKNEDVYLVYYCMNGILQSEPLIAEYDCAVNGIKSSIEEISCGDMIIIDTAFDDTVDFIRVVLSLDDIGNKEIFKEHISVPERAAWYLYGTKNNAKNEVYFGYIAKTSIDGENLKLVMYDETGKMENSEIFNVPASAFVSIYNTYKNDEKSRFEKAEIYDAQKSDVPTIDGDFDFASEEFYKEDLKYAFIYVKRGEIKEIVFVNYSK